MSKYRRVCSNVEIHEKKKSKKNQDEYNNPAYVNTTTLMEKLGIKINNSDAFTKQAASNINIRKNKAPIMHNNSIQEFDEDEEATNKKETLCRSQQKRNKNSIKNEIKTESIINVIKKKDGLSSVDKRIVKKNKKNNDNRNNISLVKKEKDKDKEKEKEKEKEKDKNKDDENIRKKTVKSKTTIEKRESENIENNKTNKKNKENAENKANKGNEEIKKTKTNKKQKNASAEKIISSSHNQNLNNDESRPSIEIRKSKKLKESEVNKKKEKEKEKEKESDKKNDNNGEKEVERKKKKNKAQSMEKEIGIEQTLKFKEKLLFGKKKKSLITGDNSDAEVEESSDSGSSSFNLDNQNKSKNQSKTHVPDIKAIVRSTKKHGTEMASQEDLVSIQRNSNKKRTSVEKEKELDGEKEAQPKIVSFRPNEDNRKNSIIFGSKYLKRRSMDNEKVRDRLEQLMNEQTLKQNGGNTLFLRNYEKGPVYQKEIEIIIKNQNIKKNIKIGSCTKAGCSGPGIVKTNQDAYFIKEDFLKNSNNLFLGVCDGHGHKGELISNYVVNKLPEYIKDINNDSIINEFKKINQEIYSNSNMESDMAGTTVVSVILTPEKMMCVNLGDSRAAIFKYENGLYYCKNLSRDHKPNEPDENKRILFNNGRIKKCFDEDIKKFVGPDRVWLKNKEEPGLAMSRSLGDKIAHTIGVSDEPEIKSYEYDGTEKFIIIASDGIWEYVHGDECIKVIKSYYEDNKDVEEAAFAMVKEAFRKWKRKEVAIDDITVVILFFDD